MGVRRETKELIRKIAKTQKMRMCDVVELAIRQYATQQTYKRRTSKGTKEYRGGMTIGKEAWYSFKLVNSIAQLKFVVDNVRNKKDILLFAQKTFETINQIESRLGIKLNDLRMAIDKYLKNPSGRNKAYLNDKTKMAMVRILLGGCA